MQLESRQDIADRMQRIETMRLRDALTGAVEAPARPKRAAAERSHGRFGLALRMVALLSLTLILMKAGLMLELGPQAYGQHRDALAKGGPLEQVSALLMAPDPVTWLISDTVWSGTGDLAAASGYGVAAQAAQAAASARTAVRRLTLGAAGEAAGVIPASTRKIEFLSAPKPNGTEAAMGFSQAKNPKGSAAHFLQVAPSN